MNSIEATMDTPWSNHFGNYSTHIRALVGLDVLMFRRRQLPIRRLAVRNYAPNYCSSRPV